MPYIKVNMFVNISQIETWEPALTKYISDQEVQEALLNANKLKLPDLL